MDLDQARIEYLKKDFVLGFTNYCGFEIESIEYGKCVALVRVKPEHCQREGFVHAGLIATLADHTGGYAAYSTVPENISILTIEFKVNFFKPAKGDMIICRARVIHKGRKIVVSESEVFARTGDREKLVSKATVTMMAATVRVDTSRTEGNP